MTRRRKEVARRVRAAWRASARLMPERGCRDPQCDDCYGKPRKAKKRKPPKPPRVDVFIAGPTRGAPEGTALMGSARARLRPDGWHVQPGTESFQFGRLVNQIADRRTTAKGKLVVPRGALWTSREAAAEAYEQECMRLRNALGSLAGDADIPPAPEYLAARAKHEAAKSLLADIRQGIRDAMRNAFPTVPVARQANVEYFYPRGRLGPNGSEPKGGFEQL